MKTSFYDSKWPVIFSFVLLLTSFISFLCDIVFLSYLTVIFVDLYLIYVILYAAFKSDFDEESKFFLDNLIPGKFWGVFVFVILYSCITFGFAEILMSENATDYTSKKGSLSHSFISLTSFDFEKNANTSVLKALQMWFSFNGLLLLTMTFGFLISRISNFKEKITLQHIDDKLNSLTTPIDKSEAISKIQNIIDQNASLKSENKKLQDQINELKEKLPSS